jgi:predicted metal-dependent phosphoesterase TrpH
MNEKLVERLRKESERLKTFHLEHMFSFNKGENKGSDLLDEAADYIEALEEFKYMYESVSK